MVCTKKINYNKYNHINMRLWKLNILLHKLRKKLFTFSKSVTICKSGLYMTIKNKDITPKIKWVTDWWSEVENIQKVHTRTLNSYFLQYNVKSEAAFTSREIKINLNRNEKFYSCKKWQFFFLSIPSALGQGPIICQCLRIIIYIGVRGTFPHMAASLKKWQTCSGFLLLEEVRQYLFGLIFLLCIEGKNSKLIDMFKCLRKISMFVWTLFYADVHRMNFRISACRSMCT